MNARDVFVLLLQKAVRMESALLVNDPESLLSAKLSGNAKELRSAVKELEKASFVAVYRKRGGKIERVVFVREDPPEPELEPEPIIPQADVQVIQTP